MRARLLLAALLLVGASASAQAQEPPEGPGQSSSAATLRPPEEPLAGSIRVRGLEKKFVRNLLADQKHFWTSPARLKPKDAIWIAPSAALLGEMLHRDHYAYRALNPVARVGESSRLMSHVGVASLAGGLVSMYAWGRMTNNDHARETGILGTQAAIGALAVGSAFNYSLARARPESARAGDFFQYGEGSFPSTHAMLAWSMATVVAHEYPGPLTKIGVYGLASAVSLARVSGRRHFLSDVVVGSALGYAIGRQVYKRHHDSQLPGMNIGTFVSDAEPEGFRTGASPYIPLDSWVYPAFDRLSALGLMPSGFRNMRPWTRAECARLLREAASLADDVRASGGSEEGPRLLAALQEELTDFSSGREGNRIALESVYTRVSGISGEPLGDGFHFGQTITNDFGRPYREGGNVVLGASAWAVSGPWSAFIRAEYQHAPSAPALPLAARVAIADPATGDATPLQPAVPFASIDRARLLDAYVALTLRNWQFSFGQQSLWWGPAEGGAMNFSHNAEPIVMFRISRVTPLVLPEFLSWLGPVRGEAFIGRLAGHQFVRTTSGLYGPPVQPQPMIEGAKLSFKPTPNLELGFSVTTLFGGPEFPVTLRTVLKTLTFRNAFPGSATDPGDRRSGFDFSYRIPRLRDRLLLYADAMTEDEFSPIGYPRRSAFRTGLYLSRVPAISKLDLRVEGAYTNLPGLRGTGSYFFNTRYLGGFTNQGNLMGDTVGRQGHTVNVQSRYWFNAGKTLQVRYRNTEVDPMFLGGGDHQDLGFTADWIFRSQWHVSGGAQYERWSFPVFGGPRTNVVTSLQLTWRPRKRP